MTVNILAIAGLELRLGIRNRWVILSVLILTLFAGVLALLGSAPTGTIGVDRLTVTAASLATLSVYLVPLIALLLAFDTVAGEIDRGTLQLVLACPVSRFEILAGKFLGHIAVLSIAVIVGYGLSGAAVVFADEGDLAGAGVLGRLIVTSTVLGAVFLAIGYLASGLVRQTGTAAALAVGVWLVAVVLYDLGLLVLVVVDREGVFATTMFPWLLVASPGDAFRLFNLAMLGAAKSLTGMAGIAEALPFPPTVALASLFAWLVAAFAAALVVFRRIEP
jgi:Cu-processing system permease protein